jgi:hypothetical protein
MIYKYLTGAVIVTTLCCLFVFSQRIISYTSTIRKCVSYRFQETSQIQTHANAFILSQCNSARYNYSIRNLERGFPKFFNFICHRYPLLNDSRVHTASDLVKKRVSSHLIGFADIWTYQIPNNSKYESEWSFVFEDDVNIVEPSQWLSQNTTFSSLNYTKILIELMHDEEVRNIHGFFYLGICGPNFEKTKRPMKTLNNTVHHYKGTGLCLHATAITKRRSRNFWSDLAFFRPTTDSGMDSAVHDFSVRSGNHFYTLGANMEMPLGTKHFGIVYQDRKKFRTTVW